MKNYTVRRYHPDDFVLWNAFISKAKNATFLFHRDFMEYHADRFQDFSLLVFKETTLVSVLPANRKGNEVFSHQGLTYGGFVFNSKIKLGESIDIIREVLKFLYNNQITSLQIKPIPSIYHHAFSEESAYTMFLTRAELSRRDCLSVLDLTQPFKFSRARMQGVTRGKKYNLRVVEELQFDLFWSEILIPNLDKKHEAKPVHSADEIIKLQQKFPENIRQFNVYYDEKIVAGTTVFITDTVAHPQYISGNQQKNELGSIDFLYHHLITQVFKEKHYFDFGPSQEQNGKKINEGILFWKEGFDAKTTIQDFYTMETANYSLLEDILL